MGTKRGQAAKGTSVEFEYEWGARLVLTLVDGAVPGDLVRLEVSEPSGRRARIELPLTALPGLREALLRVLHKGRGARPDEQGGAPALGSGSRARAASARSKVVPRAPPRRERPQRS